MPKTIKTSEVSPAARLQVTYKRITSGDTPSFKGVETLSAQRGVLLTGPVEVTLSGVGDDAGDLTLYLSQKQADKLRLGSLYRLKLVPADD